MRDYWKKALILFLSVCLCFLFGGLTKTTESNEETLHVSIVSASQLDALSDAKQIGSSDYAMPENLVNIGDASISQYLVINGYALPLYVTFNSPNDALNHIFEFSGERRVVFTNGLSLRVIKRFL